MARVDVKKFAFIGLCEQRDSFFKQAQRKGTVHFINISEKNIPNPPQDIQDLGNAIKVLRGLPVSEQVEPLDIKKADPIAKEVLKLKHTLEAKQEEQRVLYLEVERIREFGDFNFEDIAYIEKEAKRKFQFYCAKKGYFDQVELPENVIYISSDHGLDYFMGIHKEPKQHDKMVEMVFEHSLSELKEKMIINDQEIHFMEAKLKGYAKYNHFLHQALIVALNKYNLNVNIEYTHEQLGGALFAVEGWVPTDKVQELKDLVGDLGIYYEEIIVEETDIIPTYLENRGAGKIGEDLINIYDTPSHTDKDPSLWVLSAFAVFFAMIVNDAGYGFIFLATAVYLKYKYRDTKGGGRRFLNLVLILCVSCVIWGFLTTSFFGVSIPIDSPVRKVSLLGWISEQKVNYHIYYHDQTYKEWIKAYPKAAKAKNAKEFFKATEIRKDGSISNPFLSNTERSILLELALIAGIIHIALGFIRYLKKNWSGIGWILVLIGGYFYIPHYLGASSLLQYVFGVPPDFGGSEGLELIFIGIGIAVILSLIQNRLGGLTEPMTIIQIFADVLSYLRLYALGLASAIVSETINGMYGAMPLLLALVVMGLAHVVNMMLGIMGGIIHGLRLNFIEWYHYSFEGGGKPFDPLRLYEVE